MGCGIEQEFIRNDDGVIQQKRGKRLGTEEAREREN